MTTRPPPAELLLPDGAGRLRRYRLQGDPLPVVAPARPFTRIALAAAHVVPRRDRPVLPDAPCALDWDATLGFRRWLWDQGFGLAEAMDTAQRGQGLDWPTALDLIGRTLAEARAHPLRPAVVCGAGTDHAAPDSLAAVEAAYMAQMAAIERLGGRIVVMASRALPRLGARRGDYERLYRRLIEAAAEPVILHWLGAAFDPALRGYWGATSVAQGMETVLGIIAAAPDKVAGIKLSLLDAGAECTLRARLPAGVRMFTGDDFNYPELIVGDGTHHSDALLGILAAIAPAARAALEALASGDRAGYDAAFAPTLPLARHLFGAPTQYYKAGIAFQAWINGQQPAFVMPMNLQGCRDIGHYAELFRLADRAGLLRDPDRACARMRALCRVHGIEGG